TPRVWLLHQADDSSVVRQRLKSFGGKIVLIPDMPLPEQQQWWRAQRATLDITQVVVLSPFERPRSLLDLGNVLWEAGVIVSAVVFDLIPLLWPQEVLQRWSLSDQAAYQARTQQFSQLHHIWA